MKTARIQLQSIREEFAGTIVGIALIIVGTALFWPNELFALTPIELRWLFIGSGIGVLLSDILGHKDRETADIRHRESLRTLLGTLSGTPRQALRLGTALADMLVNNDSPKDHEVRYLLANARVLGVEEALHTFINERPRSQVDIETFVLLVRGHRGIEAAEGLKIGFQLEMMANDLELGSVSEQSIHQRSEFLQRVHTSAMKHFGMHEDFSDWILSNLRLEEVVPSNRVGAIRQTLKMLWQSRHLRSNASDCECGKPCEKRDSYFSLINRYKDGRSDMFPGTFQTPLSDYEQERRTEDFHAMWPFVDSVHREVVS